MVHLCYRYSTGGIAGIDWLACAERLRLHGLWDRDVEQGLAVCELSLLETHAVMRERAKPNG